MVPQDHSGYNIIHIHFKPQPLTGIEVAETVLGFIYFDDETARQKGLPGVQYLSDERQVSPRYLDGILRALAGQNTQAR